MPKIILYTPGSDTLFGPLAIMDNQSIPVALITYPNTLQSAHLEYTIERNGEIQTGRIMLVNDTVDVTLTDDNANTATELGIIFTGSVDLSGLYINYTSSLTGFPATIRYYEKKWE